MLNFSHLTYKLNDKIFTGLTLVIIAVLLTFSGALIRFDNLYYDLGRYLTFKSAPTDIVIVAIDEASLDAIGRWPWSRAVHADLINKLTTEQPSVIGLDIIFAEPELNHPEADLALEQAIAKAGNVVLPELLEVPFAGAIVKQSLPLPKLATSAAALGRVHVPLDADGIARSIYLWEGLGQANLPHFSQVVLKVAKQLPSTSNALPEDRLLKSLVNVKASETGHLIAKEQRKIKFAGPPGHFQRISYMNVLNGNYPAYFFKNKIVLIGATAVGMGDILPTPVSALTQPMPGVEFHANAIETIRQSGLIAEMPLWLSCIVCALLALMPLLWLPKFTPLKSLFAIIVYYFVVTLVAIATPHFFNVWLPPTGALVAILLAYPIWSWRKLDSAQAFLDVELQHQRDDLAKMGISAETLLLDDNEDPLQSRISKVKLTAKYLRNFHQDKTDTLSFISHDIRAPLATAIMLLNDINVAEQSKYSLRIEQMLTRALDMADNFLQISRAEVVDANKFQVLDFVSLVQEAVDSAYEAARLKSLVLRAHMPEEALWLNGDFGLLQRAVSNILLNAVKYSPENSIIQIELSAIHGQAKLQVTDLGPGIAPEKIAKLFKRFSRVEGEHQAPEGSGLGLYFVDVTVKKHHGIVSVESVLGEFTTFSIVLPLEKGL